MPDDLPNAPKEQPAQPALQDVVTIIHRELEIKAKSLENDRLHMELMSRTANTSIQANADFLRDQTVHRSKNLRNALWFGVAVLVFAGFCVMHDAKDIVLELARVVASALLGGIGGYGLKAAQGQAKPKDAQGSN